MLRHEADTTHWYVYFFSKLPRLKRDWNIQPSKNETKDDNETLQQRAKMTAMLYYQGRIIHEAGEGPWSGHQGRIIHEAGEGPWSGPVYYQYIIIGYNVSRWPLCCITRAGSSMRLVMDHDPALCITSILLS